jgi:hypothetical protein
MRAEAGLWPNATPLPMSVPVRIVRHPRSSSGAQPRAASDVTGNDTLMLLVSRYGWRVSARMHLRWAQLALAQGLVDIRRITNGIPHTPPLTEAAMRAMRVHGDELVLRGLRESAGKMR